MNSKYENATNSIKEISLFLSFNTLLNKKDLKNSITSRQHACLSRQIELDQPPSEDLCFSWLM